MRYISTFEVFYLNNDKAVIDDFYLLKMKILNE